MLELAIPAHMVPGWRTSYAVQRGVEKEILFRTWGGIGDQICAEPTIRFAIKAFKDCNVSLASEHPEFFRHLKFKRVYDLKDHQPIWENYLTLDTIRNCDDLSWQFYSHMLVNCVDYPTLCALRSMLPISEKQVQLFPTDIEYRVIRKIVFDKFDDKVVVHPGKHWQSKTFPVEWWQAVIDELENEKVTPILIGGDVDDNRGTVNVTTKNGFDLRGQLSLMETVALLKRAPVLLTNDSAPLHMAADSHCWIGFVATCKHPDMIMHWRRGGWAWRMKNHGKGGIWEVIDNCPNKVNSVEAENVGDRLLEWLPDPKEFAQWAVEKTQPQAD
jgi:ADP-heptose:LPS heptosyltransferase